MRKKYKLVFSLFLIILLSFSADNKSFILDNVKFFTIDKLNQIYILNKDNTITKYDQNLNVVMSRNLKLEGDIATLDVFNVFDILLFYKSINTLIFTDNLLNKRSSIDFNNLPNQSLQVSAVCRSFDNQIWIYDILSQKIKKIDEEGNLILESSAINSFSKKQHIFHQIVENPPFLYLLDSNNVITMNIYGKYIHQQADTAYNYQCFIFNDSVYLNTNVGIYARAKNRAESQFLPTNTTIKSENIRIFEKGKLFLSSDSLFLQSAN